MARDYFTTREGIINIIILIFNLINFICIVGVAYRSASFAFMIAAIIGFFVTGAFSLAHFLGLTEKLLWPWPHMEVIYAKLWATFYLIVSIFLFWYNSFLHAIAGIFGICTSVAYLTKGYHIYREKMDENAKMVSVKQ